MIIVGRPINGIGLNGTEYLLDDNGRYKEFTCEDEARSYLLSKGIEKKNIDEFLFLRCQAELTNELRVMAAYNRGRLQGLLDSYADDTFIELKKRPAVINLIVGEDDGVIDIEVGDAEHGSINTSIYCSSEYKDPFISADGKEGDWYCDLFFDVYDKNNELIAENMTQEILYASG